MTDAARKLAVTKLDALRAAGHDVATMMDQSILHAWDTFYPPKADAALQGALGSDQPWTGQCDRTPEPHRCPHGWLLAHRRLADLPDCRTTLRALHAPRSPARADDERALGRVPGHPHPR